MAWTLNLYLSLSHHSYVFYTLFESILMFYWVLCQRVATRVSHFKGIKNTAKSANGRQPRPCGRPSPTEDEWQLNVWGSEAVQNAKGDRGKASQRQGRSWQGFSTSGEIVAWLPNAWRDRGTPSPSCPLVFQGDRFHSPFSTIKGCTFLQRNNKI